MSAQIIEFRRKPNTPQVNPMVFPVAGYFVGLMFVGLVLQAWLDSLVEGDGG